MESDYCVIYHVRMYTHAVSMHILICSNLLYLASQVLTVWCLHQPVCPWQDVLASITSTITARGLISGCLVNTSKDHFSCTMANSSQQRGEKQHSHFQHAAHSHYLLTLESGSHAATCGTHRANISWPRAGKLICSSQKVNFSYCIWMMVWSTESKQSVATAPLCNNSMA